jgi:hypothetical protein
MALTRVALRLTPNRYVSEATMRRSLPKDDRYAPIPRSLTRTCLGSLINNPGQQLESSIL